jgi:hypothetical protein
MGKKSLRKRYNSKSKSRKQYNKKTAKSKKNFKKNNKKGGNGDQNVNCCMCDNTVTRSNTLVPRVCLNEHGSKAHRICHNCWWDPDKGFARENTPHGCPGCKREVPLTQVVKSNKPPLATIDLTED